MKTFKMFVDFDKEEAWLNRRAAEGWLLVKAGFVYTFAPIDPGSAVVRVDYRESMNAADFADYVALFADAGWQHVSGTRTSGAQYFASFTGDANAEIFSDAASKALRYRRAMTMSSAILLPFLLITVVLWTQGSLTIVPQDLYLTPGLWDREGWAFVRAFAFETPFALMRVAGPVVLVGACVVIAAQVLYQWMLYRRATRVTAS